MNFFGMQLILFLSVSNIFIFIIRYLQNSNLYFIQLIFFKMHFFFLQREIQLNFFRMQLFLLYYQIFQLFISIYDNNQIIRYGFNYFTFLINYQFNYLFNNNNLFFLHLNFLINYYLQIFLLCIPNLASILYISFFLINYF